MGPFVSVIRVGLFKFGDKSGDDVIECVLKKMSASGMPALVPRWEW